MLVIGLHGANGVGKSTTSEEIENKIIENYSKHPVVVDSFADPLKDAAYAMFNDENFWGSKEDKEKECRWSYLGPDFYSCRTILIWLGTKIMRNANPNHWVELAAIKLESLRSAKYISTIYDDVRFEEEAMHVKKNGICVAVIRNGCTFTHGISDKPLPDYYIDYTIDLDDSEWLSKFMDYIHPTLQVFQIALDSEDIK